MCSDTFLRLPEEKRQRILDAAWEEFTRVSFSEASINQIVQRSGIARGSFYQYFRDKEELMSYLMEQGWTYLMQGYQTTLRSVNGDIFALQLKCFDEFLRQRENADPVLERFMRFLRINPGLDSQKILGDRGKCILLETIWPDMDRSRLRSGEKDFVAQVLALSLGSLAGAVVDSALHFERSEAIRKELALRLDIVRRGSEKGECL